MLSLQLPDMFGRTSRRRELLRIGGLSLQGLSLPQLLALQSASGGQVSGGRSCVFIFLFGGPSQLDMWDMKPQASREIRGDFSSHHKKRPEACGRCLSASAALVRSCCGIGNAGMRCYRGIEIHCTPYRGALSRRGGVRKTTSDVLSTVSPFQLRPPGTVQCWE